MNKYKVLTRLDYNPGYMTGTSMYSPGHLEVWREVEADCVGFDGDNLILSDKNYEPIAMFRVWLEVRKID